MESQDNESRQGASDASAADSSGEQGSADAKGAGPRGTTPKGKGWWTSLRELFRARPDETPRQRRVRLAVAYGGVLALGMIVTGGAWWQTCGWSGCPSIAQLQAWQPSEGGRLLDRKGALVGPLKHVRRTNVPLTRVPAHVRAAFVAVEDRRFYKHDGVDWQGVARAAVNNLKAGGIAEGGSTITMQLARNVFLSHRAFEKSYARKLLEVRYARLIEDALTKDQILERYLNAIYLGNGVYGVEGASRDLFGKGVHDVSLAEAAMLAGLPKAPSGYSPRRSLERAKTRRDVVFAVLAREKVAPASQIEAARRTPLRIARATWEPSRNIDSWALEAVRVTLDSLRREGEIPEGLSDGLLIVRSTFDRRAQYVAERVVSQGAAQVDNSRDWNSKRTQGALVALDPTSGAIRALVGGRRVERKGFNRATRAQRQPGSTFKPFVYAAAMMHGYTPATMVEDEPITVGSGRYEWTPANYGDDYAGRITVRDALRRSANAATVRISREIGIGTIIEQARAQGINSKMPVVPALALGAGGVTPLELTAAYAPFANGGARVTPYMIERVEDIFGRVLWEHGGPQTARAMESTDAFLVTSMLQSVVDNGTGSAVRAMGIRGPVAGKTGTTNDGADVWFVGYTPTLVAGIWFGADDPTPLGGEASGGRFAAPVWARFIRDGWHSPELDPPWTPPMGIEQVTIDVTTGKLAGDWCGPARREYFRVGTAPTESCEEEYRLAMWDTLGVPDWHRNGPPDSLDIDIDSLPQISGAIGAVYDAIRNSERGRAISRQVLAEVQRSMGRTVEKSVEIGEKRARQYARRAQRDFEREIDRQMQRLAEAAERSARGRQ